MACSAWLDTGLLSASLNPSPNPPELPRLLVYYSTRVLFEWGREYHGTIISQTPRSLVFKSSTKASDESPSRFYLPSPVTVETNLIPQPQKAAHLNSIFVRGSKDYPSLQWLVMWLKWWFNLPYQITRKLLSKNSKSNARALLCAGPIITWDSSMTAMATIKPLAWLGKEASVWMLKSTKHSDGFQHHPDHSASSPKVPCRWVKYTENQQEPLSVPDTPHKALTFNISYRVL